MKLCENCSLEHDGSFASGRFCSSYCYHSFVSKMNRDEKNKKISASLTGRKSSRTKEDYAVAATRRTEKFLRELPNKDFDSLPYETKRIRVLIEQNFCCAFCKLDNWMGHSLVLEMDHEDGNNENDSRSNLRALCPNCHSSTPTWRGRKQSFVSGRWEAKEKIKKFLPMSSKD